MLTKGFVSRLFAIGVIVFFLIASFPKSVFLQDEDNVKAPQTVFSNTSPITINTASQPTTVIPASPYPSTINVSGMSGTITKVTVTIRGWTHLNLREMDFLLVSPTGAKFIFLSDAPLNSNFPGNDGVYTFDDDASNTFGTTPGNAPGTYRPTSGDSQTDTFPAPAPAAPYNQPPSATFASTFNGANPNGTWSLYVVDDTQGLGGSINSGWNLSITTSGSSQQTFSNSTYIAVDDVVTKAAPYGSTINVSGMSGVVSNLTVTLSGITHTNAQDIDVLLVSPNGRSLVLMSDAGFNVTNVNYTFDDAAPVSLPSNTSGTYRPTNLLELDTFPNPAPLRPYIESIPNAQLSQFNGFNPNGEWKLFVVDDRANDSGMISGGWSLDITTVPLQLPPVGCAFPSFVPSNFSVGASPTNLAVADFNNDNKDDVVVTNQVSNDVSILLGNGMGGFSPQTLLTAGNSPYAVAVGQFNADTNRDIVVVNSASNNISVFLGNGNGTFSAATNFVVGASPISVAVGDFNNDAKQDLAVANFGSFFSGAVSILLGNGNGSFALPMTLRTRTQPAFVTVSDINGDSSQDLVVVNFGANSVSTYFGIGNGTFTLGQNLTTQAGPVSAEVSDVSGDGVKDLIVANYNADSLSVFTGNSNGTFNTGSSTPNAGPNPISLASANLLGGTFNSIAVVSSGGDLVKVSTSAFLGQFQQFVTGLNPNAVSKGDFNSDGQIDLITANSGSNNVTVLSNTCIAAKGNLFDFNGDRKTDAAVFRPVPATWYVNGSSENYIFGRNTDTPVPADYNGDNKIDYAIFRPENGLWFVTNSFNFGNTSGTIYYLQFGLSTDIPVPIDYDGDRKADIAVFRPSDGTWYIRRSSDNSLQITQWGMNGDKPVPADYDGDGKADIAVFRPATSIWYIQRSSDNQATILQFGISTDKTVPNDYDGDGKADIAVFRDGIWYVMRSSDGGFVARSWGMSGDIPVPGDYEADGKFDFAVFRPSDNIWYILRSSDGGIQGIQFGVSGDIIIPSAYVR